MRRQLLLAASVLSLVLTGCGQGAQTDPAADADMSRMAEAAAPTGGDAASAETTAPQIPEAQVPQLAYSYRYTLEAPNRAIGALATGHEQTCVQAGPTVCQVIGSSVQRIGDDQQTATLDIRATPQWLAAFRGRLASDAEAADGRVADQATETEDLTRALVDTEAHMNAKTALRDRLQAMLATRTGDLQSALEVERELARVQGEIDAARSSLEIMRARVAMSRLTVTYQSEGVIAPNTALSPLTAAIRNAVGLFAMGLAAIVTIMSFAAPFALVIGPIVWFWLRRRLKARATEPKAAAGQG